MQVAPDQDLVVVGKVVRHDAGKRGKLWMDVRIQRVLLGKHVSKTIRVWGDNGRQCRPYIATFPVKTRWVFALRRWKKKDAVISICGEFWLAVKGKTATSLRTKKEIPIDTLQKALERSRPKKQSP